MTILRVAAAQYDIGAFQHWTEYAEKIERWTCDAAANGARLLVFPEYASMELVSLFGSRVGADLAAQLGELQQYRERFIELHRALARLHRVTIVAGSFPVVVDGGACHNRVHVVAPNGAVGTQDKIHMTRFEAERWGISAARDVTVFDTDFGTFGVAICYDAEFPLPARAQANAGAKLLIVPSCTDTLAGYHRVRIGAQARALENQCYVVHATTVGTAPWSEAVDVNIGAAGVFTPPDTGFPENGIVTLGEMNTPCWVYAELDLAKVDAVRADGQVLNHRDGDASARIAPVARVAL
jgi:predicted amidohydrolase